MIICIDEDYLATIGQARASQLYCDALQNGHYIDGKGRSLDLVREYVLAHASSYQKELMKTCKATSLTGKLRKYLTKLTAADFPYNELLNILTKPSIILVENSVNEGPVYDHLIQTYYRDPSFGSLYQKLKEARKSCRLEYANGGGCGNFVGLLKLANANNYKNISKYKYCTVIDRDANGPEYTLIQNRDNLFKLLSGKDKTTLQDDDIYTLEQPEYIWHMWYKREIENYFPDEHFQRIHSVDLAKWPTLPIDRNYKKLSEGTGFKKDKLKELTTGMSREKYEKGVKVFQCQGISISELQLFLLKLVKLI